MPSSAFNAPGEVCKGSNSRRWPSLVGIATKAENECRWERAGRGVVWLLGVGGAGNRKPEKLVCECELKELSPERDDDDDDAA